MRLHYQIKFYLLHVAFKFVYISRILFATQRIFSRIESTNLLLRKSKFFKLDLEFSNWICHAKQIFKLVLEFENYIYTCEVITTQRKQSYTYKVKIVFFGHSTHLKIKMWRSQDQARFNFAKFRFEYLQRVSKWIGMVQRFLNL